MINIYDVRAATGKILSWDDFYGNLSQVLGTIDDKDNSVVMCRDLPADWQPHFEALGHSDDQEVAWVRFEQGEDEFFFAFIAWNERILIDYVNHVGQEIMGGEIQSFVKTEKPTIH